MLCVDLETSITKYLMEVYIDGFLALIIWVKSFNGQDGSASHGTSLHLLLSCGASPTCYLVRFNITDGIRLDLARTLMDEEQSFLSYSELISPSGQKKPMRYTFVLVDVPESYRYSPIVHCVE